MRTRACWPRRAPPCTTSAFGSRPLGGDHDEGLGPSRARGPPQRGDGLRDYISARPEDEVGLLPKAWSDGDEVVRTRCVNCCSGWTKSTRNIWRASGKGERRPGPAVRRDRRASPRSSGRVAGMACLRRPHARGARGRTGCPRAFGRRSRGPSEPRRGLGRLGR